MVYSILLALYWFNKLFSDRIKFFQVYYLPIVYDDFRPCSFLNYFLVSWMHQLMFSYSLLKLLIRV